jgi:hypothetical protein
MAVLVLPGATPASPQELAGSGSIVGTVTSEASQRPLGKATVVVEGLDLVAETDVDGRFSLTGVRPGSYRLLVSHDCCVTFYRTDVWVTANRETQVSVALVDLPKRAETVQVTASAFSKPVDVASSWYSANHEEVRRAPGVLGDVNRLAQTFPGVMVSNDQRNDIVARGGSPWENLTSVDGFDVGNLNHFAAQGTTGGPISMLNTELIADVDFMAGGFPAAYGDRLSSVLDVSLREGNRDHFAADFTLDTSGAGFVVEGPLSKHGSYLASVRRSFLDLIFSKFGALTAVPHFANYQVKAVYDLGPRSRLTLLSIGGRDDIHFKVDESDTDDPSLQDILSKGNRFTTGVGLQNLLGERGVGRFTLAWATANYDNEVFDAQIGDQLIVRNKNDEGNVTAKYDVQYRIGRMGAVRAGVLGRRLTATYSVEQPIGLWNTFSTDPTRVNPLDLHTDVGTNQAGGYLELSPSFGSRVHATMGARYDYFELDDSSTVSPRAGLTVDLTSRLNVHASYGQFRQVPPLAFMTAAPGNESLAPIRADHYVGGFALFPSRDLKVTVEGYYKRYSLYPVSTQYPTLTLANFGDLYAINGLLLPLVSEGRGRARGIEFYVQKKLTSRLYGQVSYALSRTEHAALDGVMRRGGFDSPQVLSLIGGYRLNDRFQISTKLTSASGRPVTPYLEPDSRDQNRPILDLSAINSERTPDYRRLDIRFDQRHGWGWGNLNTFLDVQNITNRKNVLEYVWNPKTRSRDSVKQLSLFILGGITIEFR